MIRYHTTKSFNEHVNHFSRKLYEHTSAPENALALASKIQIDYENTHDHFVIMNRARTMPLRVNNGVHAGVIMYSRNSSLAYYILNMKLNL